MSINAKPKFKNKDLFGVCYISNDFSDPLSNVYLEPAFFLTIARLLDEALLIHIDQLLLKTIVGIPV